MTFVVGMIVVFGCLLGGFAAMGGHIDVLWQPWEYVIILGSAIGTFFVANPMKVVKIFFKEPDYYIHGTGDVNSLGSAASHGCLRMDPDEAGEVALLVMENAGQFRDWDWVKGILHIGEARTVRLATPTTIAVVP